jgi:glycosyltransferase involved in cell wall biosynthesis
LIARLVAWGLARYARGPARPTGRRVTFLLMHAWGMGGTIRVTLDLAGWLAADHDVEVLSLVRRRNRPAFRFPPGVTVTAIDDQRPGRTPFAGRLLGRLPSVLLRRDPRAAGAATLWTDVCLARRLRTHPGGVLVGTRPGLTVAALDARRPGLSVVAHEHMHFTAHRPRLQRTIVARYPEADAVVTLTATDQARFAEALGDAAARIVTIPNATRELGGRTPTLDNPVILAAGRLTNQKGFDLLIGAFALFSPEHPDWRLRICGSGSDGQWLRAEVARLGLGGRVSLPGRVRALGDEMAAASMFVLSSRFEGFPLVLLEAMQKGLPVVSFDCPTGPREVVEDGRNGILVPPEDVDALARAMLALVRDAGLRRRYGREAARAAASYRMEVIGPRWNRLIDGLLAP